MFLSVVGDRQRRQGAGRHTLPRLSPITRRAASTGRIYVISGGADGRRLLTLTREAANDGFGIGPGGCRRDVNHDGYDDLIVGAWQHSGAASSGGKDVPLQQARTAA